MHAESSLDDGGPIVDVDITRKQLECGDGVFAQLAVEHKELENYHSEYKTYAETTSSMLDECENTENPKKKRRYKFIYIDKIHFTSNCTRCETFSFHFVIPLIDAFITLSRCLISTMVFH